eukprot:9480827-Lingulodinium_polyedra.AAC.1
MKQSRPLGHAKPPPAAAVWQRAQLRATTLTPPLAARRTGASGSHVGSQGGVGLPSHGHAVD